MYLLCCAVLTFSVVSKSLRIPWTAACRAPLSMGFSLKENWSGLPCPPPEDLSDAGIEPTSPAFLVDSLPLSHQVSLYAPSVQFSRSVVSDSLWPHELQHSRPPCSSPTPGVYPNSWPLSPWCHPTVSSSVVPSSSCPQSLLASGSFQMSRLFASGGQSIGFSASTSVLPVNTQDWSPLGWIGWIVLHM